MDSRTACRTGWTGWHNDRPSDTAAEVIVTALATLLHALATVIEHALDTPRPKHV